MTKHTYPVDTLARALELHMTRDMAQDRARALLAQITPALVAQERAKWEAMSVVDFANQATGRAVKAMNERGMV